MDKIQVSLIKENLKNCCKSFYNTCEILKLKKKLSWDQINF